VISAVSARACSSSRASSAHGAHSARPRKKYAAQIERSWREAQAGNVVDGATAVTATKDRTRAKAKKRA
jgi:hypothetical protein